jgi:hypothetical protein
MASGEASRSGFPTCIGRLSACPVSWRSCQCAGSSAAAERLAKGLRDSDIRRGGATVHHLSDVAVNLAHIDHVYPGFCRQIAVIKHRRCRPVVVSGAEQVGAAHPVDVPSSWCDLRLRRGPRRGRCSGLRGWRGGRRRRWRRLLLCSGRLRTCRETARQ